MVMLLLQSWTILDSPCGYYILKAKVKKDHTKFLNIDLAKQNLHTNGLMCDPSPPKFKWCALLYSLSVRSPVFQGAHFPKRISLSFITAIIFIIITL